MEAALTEPAPVRQAWSKSKSSRVSLNFITCARRAVSMQT